MSQKIHRNSSGKRKLLYGIYTDGEDSIRRKDEWQRCAEGFADFDVGNGHGNPCKRPRFSASSSMKTATRHTAHDDNDETIHVNWSSSDEDRFSESELIVKRKEPKNCKTKRLRTDRSRNSSRIVGDMKEDPDIEFSDSESLNGIPGSSKLEGMKTKSEKVVDDVIGDYESEDSRMALTDPPASQTNPDSSLAFDNTSQDINTDSSTVSDISVSQRSKVKASEWIKSLNLKTPDKDVNPYDPSLLEDSAKKKKKFKRGGFAEQLYKIQQREKSSVRIWMHQQTKPPTATPSQESSKVITLRVKEMTLLYSLQLAQCTVVPRTDSSNLCVLFTEDLVQQYDVGPDSVIKIHPPWQEITLKHLKQRVLLCTNFCSVVNQQKGAELDNNERINTLPRETCTAQASWNCPCVTGLVMDYRYCPAFQLPSLPGLMCQHFSVDSNSDHSVDGMLYDKSCLQLVQATQFPAETKAISGTKKRRTILDSINCQETGTSGISFICLVHRVIQQDENNYRMLVEDEQGTLCEVIVPDSDLLLCQESKTYLLSGLEVKNRNTKDRNPGLFSMIEAVWSGIGCSINSQGSLDYEDEAQVKLPPGFCYTMKVCDSCDFTVETSTPVSRYHTPKLIHLVDLSEKLQDGSCEGLRTTFVAKIITITNVDGQFVKLSSLHHMKKDEAVILFVVDQHGQIDVPITVITNVQRLEPLVSVLKSRNICLFRDVLLKNGKLHCDSYTQILSDSDAGKHLCLGSEIETALKTSSRSRPQLRPLTDKCPVKSLCRISGVIVSVDENSAYSWEVCDGCEADKLGTKTGSDDLICLACMKCVREPLSRMKMEVCITCQEVSGKPVKVNLLQKTIENLLPEEADDEGYELDSVLGKQLGPLCCMLQSIKPNEKQVMQFNLEEVECFE